MKNLIPKILVLLVFMSCSTKDSSDNDTALDLGILAISDNEMAIGYFPDSQTPYVFLDENHYTIVAYDQNIDSTVDGVYLKSGDSQALMSFDTDNYLPKAITSSDGALISFYYNEELTSVTVLFHYENQDDETFVIETNPDDLTFGALGRSSMEPNDGIIEAGSLFLQVAGFSSSVVTCLLAGTVAIGGAPVTGGLATALTGPAAILSCSSAVAGFVGFLDTQNPNEQLLPTEIYVLNSTGIVLDTINCASLNLFSCLGAVTNLGPIALNTLSDAINNLAPPPINISGSWTLKEYGFGSYTPWPLWNVYATCAADGYSARNRFYGSATFGASSFSLTVTGQQEIKNCDTNECTTCNEYPAGATSGNYLSNGNNSFTVTSSSTPTTITLINQNTMVIINSVSGGTYIR